MGAVGALALTSCGGGRHRDPVGTTTLGNDPNVIAKVGDSPVTISEVRFWMSMFVGEDAFLNARLSVPRNLVADPPDYATCMRELKAIIRGGPSKTSRRRLKGICGALAADLKEQATLYLVMLRRVFSEAAELGVHVSSSQIQTTFARENAREFPKRGEFARFLAERGWTEGVDRFLVQTDLVEEGLHQALAQKYPTRSAFVSHFRAMNNTWKARALCRPGYIVEGCRDYLAHSPARKSASVLFEEIAKLAPAKETRVARDLNCKNQGKGLSCEKIF